MKPYEPPKTESENPDNRKGAALFWISVGVTMFLVAIVLLVFIWFSISRPYSEAIQ